MMLATMSVDQDSDFYSDLDSTPSRARASSPSRTSDFTTTDDDHDQEAPQPAASSSLSTLTSFDAYFLHASRPSRTSSNLFSQLVQPLSADEYAASLSRSFYPHPFPNSASAQTSEVVSAATAHRVHLPRYLLELAEGFNLLFYGFGSKRRALNDLARACATTTTSGPHGAQAHVLVLNGFLPSFSARDILAALARLPGAPQTVEAVAQFLSAEPTAPAAIPNATTSPSSSPSPPPSTSAQQQQGQGLVQHRKRGLRRRRLVLVIHNIDAPALRAPKVRGLLSALAAQSGVQLAASVDHINAPQLWTSTELLSQRWLWHDLTTLSAYDVELAGADPASLRGAPTASASAAGTSALMRAGGGLAESMGGHMMTETAARHVLAAVTQRARKLFVLMGRRQLDALADAAGGSGGGMADPTTPAEAQEVAVPYDTLFNLARDHFVATNDTALRALLGEFRDHGLVVTVSMGAMGSGEILWIPLRKERLTKLLDGLGQADPP
ncbi:ORC2-domain-containing protein [Russula ochroleuca]|jgi:origin recognition complex subunit 2|uniref:Origin recognition complex subunit 2 n=1 Tax=Russula ochroleuca TaxID=152965 RepID=A0A9P5MT97_9AGAM|nr:ORC2-domain-containing protein [Russula ochroleuca]